MLSSKRYRWQDNGKIVSISAEAAGFQKEGKPRDTIGKSPSSDDVANCPVHRAYFPHYGGSL